jgi:hypothetical protein
MRYGKVLFIITLIPFFCKAQINPRKLEERYTNWKNGTVVLDTGDTIACELSYNQTVSEGLLQVKDGDNVLTLTVNDVFAFSYFDHDKEHMRTFLALAVKNAEGSNYKRKYFLEYHYGNDKIAIVSHKTIFILHINTNYYNDLKKPVPIAYRYLLNVETDEIFPFDEDNAIFLMKDKEKIIKNYMNENKLKLRKEEDYIKVFQYYASLF